MWSDLFACCDKYLNPIACGIGKRNRGLFSVPFYCNNNALSLGVNSKNGLCTENTSCKTIVSVDSDSSKKISDTLVKELPSTEALLEIDGQEDMKLICGI